jgi:hypothetical protein
MGCVRKTFVEFAFPGESLHTNSAEEVKSRDVSKVKVPVGAYGFKFFDVIAKQARINGRVVETESRRMSESPTYFCGGRLYSMKDVRRGIPNGDVLITIMRANDCTKVIKTRAGNICLFDKKDVLLKSHK